MRAAWGRNAPRPCSRGLGPPRRGAHRRHAELFLRPLCQGFHGRGEERVRQGAFPGEVAQDGGVRGEIERGIFDVESVRKANENLISAVNESITIAEEGRKRRVAAEKDLVEMEGKLKGVLLNAAQAQKQQLLARA